MPFSNYQILDQQSVLSFVSEIPSLTPYLGGTLAGWQACEVGDGNVNLVFAVQGPAGSLCLKQALPFVRMVGESWPLTVERAFFEYQCLEEHRRHVPDLLPKIYYYDPKMRVIVMEYLHPHLILLKGMMAGIRYPRLAEDISEYLARTLFYTSSFGMPAAEKKRKMALFCGNTELCRIMEDVIFTDPYHIHVRNRWTSPQLDSVAAEFREDVQLKIAASRLKLAYMTKTEALIHGDLHTGSIMVTPENTRVIDHEFAFYGPMGFDIGAVIGNLLLNYFSQEGYTGPSDSRGDYQEWLLDTVECIWLQFQSKFIALWESNNEIEVYPPALFDDAANRLALAEERRRWLRECFEETMGYCGAKIIRRILGQAHGRDMEQIEDPDLRASCELPCLRLAREMMVNARAYKSIREVTMFCRELRQEGLRLVATRT
ncbi:MAG TPA: S-methyl-5-thioribose kinase [Candidatus Solibacter sp.]|nr:S-methyl-5-thioribose kinase [Candidatus Solibacter sp.]